MVLGDPFFQPKSKPSEVEGRALPYDRLAAHIADLVLLMPIMALAMAPYRREVMDARLLGNVWAGDWALIQSALVAGFVGILWESAFIGVFGTSPGRAIFGLRVVDIWTGEKPRPFHAFARAIAWWVSLLALGAPFFGVYGNLRRRPLHDRIADTEVISMKPRRQAGDPTTSELALGSLMTSFAAAIASLVLMGQFVVLREHAQVAEEKAGSNMCTLVTGALEDWEGTKPSRISAALSLSSVNAIDSSCLEQEADYAIWNDRGRLLGYFAKGLVRRGTDAEDSDSYFSQVCSGEPDSEMCRMVGWYRSVERAEGGEATTDQAAIDKPAETLESLEKLARSFTSPSGRRSTSEWLRLLTVRELLQRQGDSELVFQLAQAPSHHTVIGSKLVEYRARALWRLDRKADARAMVWSVSDALSRAQKASVSSWLCGRELYESSCDGGDATAQTDIQKSCDMMDRTLDAENGDYSSPSMFVTALRYSECKSKSSKGLAQLEKLDQYAEEDSARRLVEAVRMLRTGDDQKGLTAMRELASTPEASEDLFVTEANIRLLEELAKKPASDRDAAGEIRDLKERWFNSREARRHSDWGRALFAALSRRGEWNQATEVGILLGSQNDLDRSLQKRIAVAAWKAGKQKLAAEMVEAVERVRVPASIMDSEGEDGEVFEAIRRSGRRK